MPKNKSFTLIELLIAASILTVIMLALAVSFHTGIFGYRNIESTLVTAQTAIKVLERINADLRNAFAYSGEETKFSGSKNEMSFLALVPDYAFVWYKLEDNKLLRVCLRNQESLNKTIPVSPQILAANLAELVFTYSYFNAEKQALDWKDTAEKPDALPTAVKVKLTIKDKAGQDFERTIYLALAG